MKVQALLVFLLAGSMSLMAQKSYQLQSPDRKLQTVVTVGDNVEFSLTHDGTEVLAPSAISMTLQNGEVLGAKPKVCLLYTSSLRWCRAAPGRMRLPDCATYHPG